MQTHAFCFCGVRTHIGTLYVPSTPLRFCKPIIAVKTLSRLLLAYFAAKAFETFIINCVFCWYRKHKHLFQGLLIASP